MCGRESTVWFDALKSLKVSKLRVRPPKSSLWSSPSAHLVCRNMQNPIVTSIARTPIRPNINAISDDSLFSSWLLLSWCSGLGFLGLSRCSSGLLCSWLGLWRSPEGLNGFILLAIELEITMRCEKSFTYQVISQELHDQCGVLVALLTKGIEF